MAKKVTKGLKNPKITKIITGKHELTEKEMAAAGRELADLNDKTQQLKDEAKLKAQEFKDLITAAETKAKKVSDKLRTGEEDRDYECTVVKDEENKQIVYTDIKTKRVIKKAPFTAADYQYSLDEMEEELIGDGKGKKKMAVVKDHPAASTSKIDKKGLSKSSSKKKADPAAYKFQTGDIVKNPVGKAFVLTLEDMGTIDKHKKLRLATPAEIEAAGLSPKSLTPGGESKGYSHNSLLGEKD